MPEGNALSVGKDMRDTATTLFPCGLADAVTSAIGTMLFL